MTIQTRITPKYLNMPKEGRKYASVKDDRGALYWLSPDYLSWFAQNEPADVEFTEQNWGGKTANVLTKINGRDITGAQQPSRGDRPAPSPTHAPVRAATEDEKSLSIFCTGVTQQIASAGVIQAPHEIKMWLEAAKEAWETVMMGKAQQPAPQTAPQAPTNSPGRAHRNLEPETAGYEEPAHMREEPPLDDSIPF